jgi:hypothetical protein
MRRLALTTAIALLATTGALASATAPTQAQAQAQAQAQPQPQPQPQPVASPPPVAMASIDAHAQGRRIKPHYCANRDAYQVTACSRPPGLPRAPFTRQLSWVLLQLGGDAATVTEGEVTRHFSPALLAAPNTSAPALVGALTSTLDRYGRMRLQGSRTRRGRTRRWPSSRREMASARRFPSA